MDRCVTAKLPGAPTAPRSYEYWGSSPEYKNEPSYFRWILRTGTLPLPLLDQGVNVHDFVSLSQHVGIRTPTSYSNIVPQWSHLVRCPMHEPRLVESFHASRSAETTVYSLEIYEVNQATLWCVIRIKIRGLLEYKKKHRNCEGCTV